MSDKQTDLTILCVMHHDFQEDKQTILMLVARGLMTVQQYNQAIKELEHNMNATQFRYIDKYKVMDSEHLTTRTFELSPEDLAKFNYN